MRLNFRHTRESGTATGTGQFAAIQAVALAIGVELSPIGVRSSFRHNLRAEAAAQERITRIG